MAFCFWGWARRPPPPTRYRLVVLGAPGHAASAATAIDGYPMTKRGEGGRALGAAYMSALMGGIFGAILMGVTLPIIRPAILFIGSPELLGLAVFGISMVAVLSRQHTAARPHTMACFGMMIAMIGSDPQTGTLRLDDGQPVSVEGLPLVPVTLGVSSRCRNCAISPWRAPPW